MTTRRFTFRWLTTAALLVLFILAFPFILPPLVRATGCAGVGGACGAMALLLGIYLRLPVVLGVGVFIAVLTWKRSRSVGAHPWVFIFVLLMYLAALPFLLSFGNFWGASFALGLIRIGGPLPIVMLLATLISLSYLPDSTKAWRGSLRLSTLVTGGFAILLTADQWIRGMILIPFIGTFFRSVLFPVGAVAALLFRSGGIAGLVIITFAFVASLAWWVIAARRVGASPD